MCECKCIYKPDIKLNFEQQKSLIIYLKSKDIIYTYDSFNWVLFCEIDNFIKELYNLSNEELENLKKQYDQAIVRITAINHNFLRIMGGQVGISPLEL